MTDSARENEEGINWRSNPCHHRYKAGVASERFSVRRRSIFFHRTWKGRQDTGLLGDSAWQDFVQNVETNYIKLFLVLLVVPSKETAPSYYDKNSIMISMMDEEDAWRAQHLI